MFGLHERPLTYQVWLYKWRQQTLTERRITWTENNKICHFSRESSEMMIKCGFICKRYNVNLVSVGSLNTTKFTHPPQNTRGLLFEVGKPKIITYPSCNLKCCICHLCYLSVIKGAGCTLWWCTSCFVWFDSLRPSQQFFSHVRMGLPGLNQY